MQDLEFAEFLMKKRKYELWPKILEKIQRKIHQLVFKEYKDHFIDCNKLIKSK